MSIGCVFWITQINQGHLFYCELKGHPMQVYFLNEYCMDYSKCIHYWNFEKFNFDHVCSLYSHSFYERDKFFGAPHYDITIIHLVLMFSIQGIFATFIFREIFTRYILSHLPRTILLKHKTFAHGLNSLVIFVMNVNKVVPFSQTLIFLI